jgi:hypothetical protein
METTVSQMTVSELRELIADVVHEELAVIADPDYGLEIRDEVRERILQQSEDLRLGRAKTISFEELLVKLDMDPSELESEEYVPAAIS